MESVVYYEKSSNLFLSCINNLIGASIMTINEADEVEKRLKEAISDEYCVYYK